jgi:hypothetical protein
MVAHNTVAIVRKPDIIFVIYPQFTPTQARAFELLNVTAKAVATKPDHEDSNL